MNKKVLEHRQGWKDDQAIKRLGSSKLETDSDWEVVSNAFLLLPPKT
jgi:hypothetical protein